MLFKLLFAVAFENLSAPYMKNTSLLIFMKQKNSVILRLSPEDEVIKASKLIFLIDIYDLIFLKWLFGF